jgi:hypothetical protein
MQKESQTFYFPQTIDSHMEAMRIGNVFAYEKKHGEKLQSSKLGMIVV